MAGSLNRRVDPESGYGYHSGLLAAGDLIRQLDGSLHYVQYVNSSGAYVVPLAAVTKEIAGHTVNFTAGGRTISSHSLVERLDPETLGTNSPEYRRYVIMAKASKEGPKAKRPKGSKAGSAGDAPDSTAAHGVALGEFEAAAVAAPTIEAAEGHTADLQPETVSDSEDNDMAKKAAKAGNGKPAAKAKRAAKPPKTVRKCACNCGTETTGYFAPGHDARMHGWIAKLADGRIEPSAVPAPVRNKLGLVQTKTGFKASHPHFWKQAE